MEFLTKLLGIATAVAETTTGAADPAAVTTDSAAAAGFRPDVLHDDSP